jgi:hypothetical protein
MAVTHTLGRAAVTRAAISGLLLVLVGVAGGLLFGLFLIHLLGWLGLHVDLRAGAVLRRAFLP